MSVPGPQSTKVLTVYLYPCPVCGDATTTSDRICHHIGREHRKKPPVQIRWPENTTKVAYLPASESIPRAVAEGLHKALGQLHAEAFVVMQDLMAIAADAVPEPRQVAAERYESLLEYLDRSDAALKSYREAVPDEREEA